MIKIIKPFIFYRLEILLFCGFLISTNLSAQQIEFEQKITAMPGWKIMQDGRQGNCITCHTIQLSEKSVKEKQGNFAPPLSKVGAKYTSDQLRQWVTDARLMNPETLMPPYGSLTGINNPNLPKSLLDSKQISDVVDVLAMLK
jgi:sulfur-oxidizing protein SoxX